MKHHPSWRTNLVVFIALLVILGSYFYYQTLQATGEFQKHSQEHSEILAAVVELNIRNAILAREGLEDIVAGSLENSGRFLHYLDSVEPFSSFELTAFAKESGFAGVKIISTGTGSSVSGPAHWLSTEECYGTGSLRHLVDEQLYLYTFAQSAAGDSSKCILIGLPAKRIEETLAEISVQRLLAMFNDLHDIAYVRLESINSQQRPLSVDGVTETLLPMGNKQLVVALKNTRLGKRRARMQLEFELFIGFMVLCGGVSTWWLYRVQQQRLQQARAFEQKMARQHEDAALGRAAATITHELRNPLNAIGMGLQRLQIENNELDTECQELLESMRESVQRSNTILTRLKQYGDSFTVARDRVHLLGLLTEVVRLYQVQCEEQDIAVQLECDENISLRGDKILLAQLFENCIKNAIEAQVGGGFLHVTAETEEKNCLIEIRNGCFQLSEEESRLMFEPYFTSKSRGTGLGLVISNKIVRAHGGELDYHIDFTEHIMNLSIRIPLR